MANLGGCIGIDCRYLSHRLIGGVQTYVSSLVSALLRLDSPHEFILYGDAKAPFDLDSLTPNATLRTLPWRNGASTVRNDLRLGAIMAEHGVDLAHFPANHGFGPRSAPTLVTLHDAMNTLPIWRILQDDQKDPRHILVMTYLHLMTMQTLRRSPTILTVSEYSKRVIIDSAHVPESRVHAVHSAQDASFRPSTRDEREEVRRRHGLRPFVVLADAIKNPFCTLRAFRALPPCERNEMSLVFFSRREPSAEVKIADREGLCTLLLRPSRDELIKLLSLADVFVFPSWYEGFGLPVLESMSCKTPVIASSRGSLPEVTGDGGIIVDAEDHESIERELLRLKHDAQYLQMMSERALAWSKNFSWERTARRTLDIYTNMIEQSRVSARGEVRENGDHRNVRERRRTSSAR